MVSKHSKLRCRLKRVKSRGVRMASEGTRFCYSSKIGSENEPFRSTEKRYRRRHEGKGRNAPQRPAHGQGGAAIKRSGKDAPARRNRVHPAAPNVGEAAQGIH